MKRWREIFKPVTWRSNVKPISFQHSSENRAKDSKFKRNVNWVVYVVLFQLLDLCKEAVLRALQLNNKDDSKLLISLFSVFRLLFRSTEKHSLCPLILKAFTYQQRKIPNFVFQLQKERASLFKRTPVLSRISLDIIFSSIRRIFPIIHSIMKLNSRTEISKWLNKLGN